MSGTRPQETPAPPGLGHRQRLAASRSLVLDLLHYHRTMPSVSHVRRFELRELHRLREATDLKISWSLFFIKAFALTGRQFPRLRQTFMTWPWPHLYEHPFSVANIALTRSFRGEEWLFFAPLHRPEQRSLWELQQLLDGYRHQPVERVFRSQLRLAHLPQPVRRLIWWFRLHKSGSKRIKRLGTFGLTTLAGQGTTIVDPRAPVPYVLSYGPFDERARCDVTLTYDHRITDGLEIARILSTLEQTMMGQLTQELIELQTQRDQRQAA